MITLSDPALPIKTPGFYSLSAETYHSDPCESPSLSSGLARTLLSHSPLHAYHEHPKMGAVSRDATPAMDFGSLVHALVLGQGPKFAVTDEFEDWRKKAAQEFKAQAIEDGKIPMLSKDFDRAAEAAKAVRKQLDSFDTTRGVFVHGHNELTAVWQEESGVWCRAMFDNIVCNGPNVAIWDLKTSTDANPANLGQKCFSMGYHIQDAFYTRGVETLIPEAAGRIDFILVFVETKFPFATSMIQVDEAGRTLGRQQVERALDRWRKCLKADVWPGYPEYIVEVQTPVWALGRMEE